MYSCGFEGAQMMKESLLLELRFLSFSFVSFLSFSFWLSFCTYWYMRFISDNLNLLLFILIFTVIPSRQAESLNDVWFPSTNFTYCYQGEFDVTAVTRYFDVMTSSYHFNINSTSNVTINNLNQQGSSKYISTISTGSVRGGFSFREIVY